MPVDSGDIIEEAVLFVETDALTSTDVAPDNVVEDAALTEEVFLDAEALEPVEECLWDTKDVEVGNVGVDAEDIEGLCVTVFEFVEYVELLDVGIKVAESVVIIDDVVWVENDALLVSSGIFVVEYVVSGNAVDIALVVIVAEASADVGVVGVAAGELANLVFKPSIDTVLFNERFVVDAEYAEIPEVADEFLSFIVVFDKGCGVVEYMELMNVGFVGVEDEEIVDVGIVIVTIEAFSDKDCGAVEYMKLMDVGVVNVKDVGVVVLDDVSFVE